jgi:hypothetical protein
MSDFVIPKGKEFRFNIRVIEKDSFIAQDVTNLDTVNSTIKFINPATSVCLSNTGITIEKVPVYTDGVISVTVPSSITNLMVVNRGEEVDGYYLKPTYQMIIELIFTDSTPDRVVVLDKVYVIPASC